MQIFLILFSHTFVNKVVKKINLKTTKKVYLTLESEI